MTAVILLLECVWGRTADFLVSLRMIYYSVLTLYTIFVALYHTYMYLDAVCHWLNYYLSSDLIASPEWMVLFFFRITRINKTRVRVRSSPWQRMRRTFERFMITYVLQLLMCDDDTYLTSLTDQTIKPTDAVSQLCGHNACWQPRLQRRRLILMQGSCSSGVSVHIRQLIRILVNI